MLCYQKDVFATNATSYILTDQLKGSYNHLFQNYLSDNNICESFDALNPCCFCY